MIAEVFFDSNIICYAFDLREPDKRIICLELMNKGIRGYPITDSVIHATARLTSSSVVISDPHFESL